MAPRTSLALFLFLNLLFFTYTTAQGTCPRNALQIGACTNVLNAIDLTLGNPPPPVPPCCSLIAGLADLEAAVCLCTALDVNVLGINVHLPIDISVLLNACSRFAPPSFQCPKDSSRPGLSLDSSHPTILSKLLYVIRYSARYSACSRSRSQLQSVRDPINTRTVRDPFQLVSSNVPARSRPPLIGGPFNPT
uniref:Bifunctional inhibitor/plant lipid transfer protein/seed storage helical domain-containing protein n=3 Tax=Brassica TaxID=3705 RepID=M4DPP3_BRACM